MAIFGPAPYGQQRMKRRLGCMVNEWGMIDHVAGLFHFKPTGALLPFSWPGERPVEFGRRMIMVLVVAQRPEHQEAEDKIVAFKKSLWPDDFAPAVVLAKSGAENLVGVGFGL